MSDDNENSMMSALVAALSMTMIVSGLSQIFGGDEVSQGENVSPTATPGMGQDIGTGIGV